MGKTTYCRLRVEVHKMRSVIFASYKPAVNQEEFNHGGTCAIAPFVKKYWLWITGKAKTGYLK